MFFVQIIEGVLMLLLHGFLQIKQGVLIQLLQGVPFSYHTRSLFRIHRLCHRMFLFSLYRVFVFSYYRVFCIEIIEGVPYSDYTGVRHSDCTGRTYSAGTGCYLFRIYRIYLIIQMLEGVAF